MSTSLAWHPQEFISSPLFAPLHSLLERLGTARFPGLQECNALLAGREPPITVENGLPLKFVAQAHGKLPFEAQYEPRCYLRGEVQTREENWHDLFNALVWLTFPATKAAINARHYRSLTAGLPENPHRSQRGGARDMLTLLDESGVVVACADPELAGLLRGFRWEELFWHQRERLGRAMGFYLFGHGLYEKALRPYIGMTGQGLVLDVDTEFFGWPLARQLPHLDEALAKYLSEQEHCRATRELNPVPLLGIPGWTPDNGGLEYYKKNTGYFRAGRLS